MPKKKTWEYPTMKRQTNKTTKRILIANRGEIAIRIAKAIRELGYTAIGVWTDNEPMANHLLFCDEWVHLEGDANNETYLNIEKLVSLAVDVKADAVHPGYGFLSENYLFLEALEKKGIIFIGPNVEALNIMGDKSLSKIKAKEAGVPVVPGSSADILSVAEALKVAEEIKYPVLLKAIAGGGGRGMRICHNKEEVEENFEAVKREALSSFGNDGLLVEKFIEDPHHIEVQILGDKQGNVFHFFERECSVQRRHQKIVEEAPSPFIGDDDSLRESICQTAVKLAQSVNYDSAGTVEFIMAKDKSFYFLEMNTRIQVEHPITEEITGVDLIVCMIQSAFKEDLLIPSQSWITKSGHSVECRICAEDPITMLPAPGTVTGFSTNFPQGVRFDHCIYRNLNVTGDFDPMVGKLITKGINRDVAIRKMRSALDGLFIEGLKTNIPLHKVILNDEEFLSGDYSTKYIESSRPQDRVETELSHEGICRKLAIIEAVRVGI
jgi:acetyl-CoA carboxylase, biotin carboxylase subunit